MAINSQVASSYNLLQVALSFGIAFLGSWVAFAATRRIRGTNGRVNTLNVVASGLALGGIGVWSMHFIGMQALVLDLRVGYSVWETLLSLVAAVTVTSLAMAYVARRPSLPRIALAGFFLGLGVCVMHYLGMYAMRFGGYIDWNFAIVAASVLVAVLAASAALWLLFNVNQQSARALAAVLMALAVCAMHYTGMAAADFICTTADRTALVGEGSMISSFRMPFFITAISIGVAYLISVDQLFQRILAPRT